MRERRFLGARNGAGMGGVCSLMRQLGCANMALIVVPTLIVRG